MLQNLIVTMVLMSIVICVWIRRRSWPLPWDRGLTLSVLLQGVGFALCIPANGRYVGRLLFEVTGIGHLRDYIGHSCFIAASITMVHVAASRLMPDDQVGRFMRRVEVPAAVAAPLMLLCLLSTPQLRIPGAYPPDFFIVRHDAWLDAYWLIFVALSTFVLVTLINLLFVLRHDERNRVVATLYINACRAGFISVFLIFINVVAPGARIDSIWVWLPLCLSGALSVAASTVSWMRRLPMKPADRR